MLAMPVVRGTVQVAEPWELTLEGEQVSAVTVAVTAAPSAGAVIVTTGGVVSITLPARSP